MPAAQRLLRAMVGLGRSRRLAPGCRGAPSAFLEAKQAAESIRRGSEPASSDRLSCMKRKFWQGLSSMWYCDVALLPQCQLSTARNCLARRLVPVPAGFLP